MRHKYKSETKIFNELENEISVPFFQRRLVWSTKQKIEFIETLNKGYPFGSILIYQYAEDKKERKYTLIDGLQRYTTILDFKDNPHKYIKINKHIEKFKSILTNQIKDISSSTEKGMLNKVNDIIKEFISDIDGNLKNPLFIRDKVIAVLKELGININSEETDKLVMLQIEIKEYVEAYLDIKNIKIPTIIFTGHESELATVFENLNRGGKKLTKYQVFSAQWSKYEIKLSNSNISNKLLEMITNRYDDLIEDRKIEIEGYDKEKFKDERKINIAECCYAIGKLILKNVPVFWDYKKDDLADTIGYCTIAIVLDIPIQKLHKIIDKKEFFNNGLLLDNVIEDIINEYNKINNYFEKYLKYPGTTIKKFEGKPSDMQILSYFSALWSIKYNNIINYDIGKIEKNSRYKIDYNKVVDNMLGHYINDLFSEYWSGSGDSKVKSIRDSKGSRYIAKVKKENLEMTLLDWWSSRSATPSIRTDKLSRTLLVIQSNLEIDAYHEQQYDIEHIIPQNSLNKIYKDKKIPGGSLGNIMFLEKGYNRSKREINIYDHLHESQKADQLFIRSRFYPSQSEISKIEMELKDQNSNLLQLRKTLDTRAKNIINNLLNSL